MNSVVSLDRRSSERPIGAALWSLVAAGGNAVAGVIAARLLAPADRGILAVTLSAAGLLGTFCVLGTNVAFRALLPRDPRVTMVGFWRLTALLAGALAIPVLFVGTLVTSRLVDRAFMSLPGMVAFLAFGLANLLWFQTSESLAAIGQIRHAARISASGSALLALAMIGYSRLSVHSSFTVSLIYAGSLCAQVLVASRRLFPQFSLGGGGAGILLRRGPKMMGSHFGADLVYRADRYMLGALAGTASVGFYAVATTPAELLKIPVNAIAQYTLHEAARGKLRARALARTTIRWFLIELAVAGVAWPLAPFAIRILFGETYAPSVGPLRILLLAQVAIVPHLIYSRALVGLGATWPSSIAGLVGLAVLLGSGVYLMPRAGALGAAYASLAAYCAMSIVSVFLVLRHSTIKNGRS